MLLQDLVQENLSPRELYTVERFANDLWGKLGVDVKFSTHFLQRANDERNNPPITVDDLVDMFRKAYRAHSNDMSKLPDGTQAVLRDMLTQLNLPFVMRTSYGGRELIAKTVMRKAKFKTTNPVFTVKEALAILQAMN